MNTFLENALTRKPLQLVRKQAHCSDETLSSRYSAVSIFDPETTLKPKTAQSSHGNHGGGRSSRSGSGAPLRHMSLLDLIFFGIGTTIGSGVFVLAGVVAHNYAGPSASLSYLIAGSVAALSGLPYAELSAAFPLDGSTYSYAYITLGEVFAVMASLCQTLEYGGASAAVARSWGSKFVDWVHEGRDESNPLPTGVEMFLEPGYDINPMGAIIAFLCTLLLLVGVKESKMTTNIVSATKVSLIVFMIVAGFVLASGVLPNSDDNPASFQNWNPFVPSEFGGLSGIIDGSSILFFAFLGFDQICNLSGEAKNPVRDVPRAVVCTLLIDAIIYMLAALALTAMVPYASVDTVSAFPRALGANGLVWAEKMTAIGEIVTLPLVVLTGIQSQTRLFFAMSKDKLVPTFFGKQTFSDSRKYCCVGEKKEDKIGNLTANVQFCGVVIIILACFVPFQYIESLISAGALFLFSLTDVCLLMIRYKCPSESFLGVDDCSSMSMFSIVSVREQLSLGRLLILLNVFSFLSGACFAFIPIAAVQYSLTAIFALLTCCVTIYIHLSCPEACGNRFTLERDDYGKKRFQTPLVPYLPALGIFANWFMLANIGWEGIAMLVAYLFLGVIMYGGFCSGTSLTTEYESDSSSFTNILPDRSSPNSSVGSPLQEALLPGGEWEDEADDNLVEDIQRGLSEIETSKATRDII